MSHPHDRHITAVTGILQAKSRVHGIPFHHYEGDIYHALTHPNMTRVFDLAHANTPASQEEGEHRLVLTLLTMASVCEYLVAHAGANASPIAQRTIKAAHYAITGILPDA